MQMHTDAKLRHHLAAFSATFDGATATWHEDGRAQRLIVVDGPLSASAIVDAHVGALADGVAIHVAYAGAASPVATRTAARLGVRLLDVATLADPTPAPEAPVAAPTVEPIAAPVLAPAPSFPAPFTGMFRALERAPAEWSVAADAAFDPIEIALPPAPEIVEPAWDLAAGAAFDPIAIEVAVAPEIVPVAEQAFLLPPAGFFRALERVAAEPTWDLVADVAFDVPLIAAPEPEPIVIEPITAPEPEPIVIGPIAAPEPEAVAIEPIIAPEPVVAEEPSLPVVEELIVAPSTPEPEVAFGDIGLPWDVSVQRAEIEPMRVSEEEVAAMPWSPQHEMLPAGRSHQHAPARPTLQPDWGLPWPRPMPTMDGVSIADPRVWHAQERIQAVREDLDRVGAPSFGAARPEGSAWLKRISDFGAP